MDLSHGSPSIESLSAALTKFDEQLPYRCGPLTSHSRINFEQNRELIVKNSQYKFGTSVLSLARILKSINDMKSQPSHGQQPELERNYFESQQIVLDTLDKCFIITPIELTYIDDENTIKLLLSELLPFVENDSQSSSSYPQLKTLASKVILSLSLANYEVIYKGFCIKLGELVSTSDENPDFSGIEIMQHASIDAKRLTRLFCEIVINFKSLKKHLHGVLLVTLEKIIWNWMDRCSDEYNNLIKLDELSDVCDKLFEHLDAYSENNTKRKVNFWPLQMLLLLNCPKIVEEVVNVESGAPGSVKNAKKRKFIEDVRKSLSPHSSSAKQMTEAAIVTCVKLCRASTYINQRDSNNCIFVLVQSVINELKSLMFNSNKPFARNQATITQDAEFMTDCFVSLFRITPHNNEIIKVCLNPTSTSLYHYVFICSLYKIATQNLLPWWPKIDMLFSKAPELRNMFSETVQRVSQSLIVPISTHTPLKMIQVTFETFICCCLI